MRQSQDAFSFHYLDDKAILIHDTLCEQPRANGPNSYHLSQRLLAGPVRTWREFYIDNFTAEGKLMHVFLH